MTPHTSKDNPWFMEVWQKKMNCSYPNKTYTGSIIIGDITLITCDVIEHIPMPPEDIDSWVVTTFDGVYAVAYALDKLIRERCPEKLVNNEGVRDCVKTYDLLGYLQNSSFQGASWMVQFDELGNLKGPYEFRQYYNSRSKREIAIALWDMINDTLLMKKDEMDWSVFWGGDTSRNYPPDSVCSNPCGPRFYYQYREQGCCWDCIACRNNERLNDERKGCIQCPEFYWPDMRTATYCVPIEPE